MEAVEQSPPVVIPDWLAGIDAEESAELATFGITPAQSTLPADEASRDALASTLLRRVALVESDIQRHEDACAHEVEAVAARYARITAPLRAKKRGLDTVLTMLAAGAAFIGKAKSRKLGWGVIGRRKQPDGFLVVNADAARAHLVTTAPDAINIVLVMTLAQAREILPPVLLEGSDPRVEYKIGPKLYRSIADETGTHGVRVVPGDEVPYFSAESPLVQVLP